VLQFSCKCAVLSTLRFFETQCRTLKFGRNVPLFLDTARHHVTQKSKDMPTAQCIETVKASAR